MDFAFSSFPGAALPCVSRSSTVSIPLSFSVTFRFLLCLPFPRLDRNRVKKSVKCRDFSRGDCRRGSRCRFVHATAKDIGFMDEICFSTMKHSHYTDLYDPRRSREDASRRKLWTTRFGESKPHFSSKDLHSAALPLKLENAKALDRFPFL